MIQLLDKCWSGNNIAPLWHAFFTFVRHALSKNPGHLHIRGDILLPSLNLSSYFYNLIFRKKTIFTSSVQFHKMNISSNDHPLLLWYNENKSRKLCVELLISPNTQMVHNEKLLGRVDKPYYVVFLLNFSFVNNVKTRLTHLIQYFLIRNRNELHHAIME